MRMKFPHALKDEKPVRDRAGVLGSRGRSGSGGANKEDRSACTRQERSAPNEETVALFSGDQTPLRQKRKQPKQKKPVENCFDCECGKRPLDSGKDAAPACENWFPGT